MVTDNTRESLDLLYHVSRELATALDLRTVLQRVLFLSVKNVGAERGSIIVLDNRGLPLEAAIVFGNQMHGHAAVQMRETFDKGLAGWVARHRESVLIPDTSQDTRWVRRPDDAPDRSGAKSAICVPLESHDRLVGVLTVVHPKPGYFNQEHLSLLQAIADQAGVAVLNARLYSESQHQARVMTALAESAVTMNASLQLDDVLQRILDQTTQAMRVEAVLLALIDEPRQELVFRAATSRYAQAMVGLRQPLGQGVAGKVVQEGKGAFVATPDEGIENRIPGLEIRAILGAPVQAQGRPIGAILAINPVADEVENDALMVLTGIGGLAGTAIHNAQLYEQLQAAHQRYRELFEDSIDPILITDWNGRILEANRQALQTTRYSQSTLQQMTIDQLHDLQREKTGPAFENLIESGTISYESTLRLNASGQTLPIQVYVRRVNMDGSPSLQWILRDISERKDLDALREDLIAMVYHDLRSPLANVVSSLDVMETLLNETGSSTLQPVLNIAIRSTDRMQRLISSLLDIHRLEAGQPIANKAEVDSRKLVEEAVDVIRLTLENKQQTAVISVPDQLPPVWVDADMVRRVLINLLENAMKFTHSQGQIEIGAQAEGQWVRFWVKDNGPGIPKAQSEAIFDKFTRLRTEGSVKGLGLGLAFCRLAVQSHGGKIWVESELGAGSKFLFTIPQPTTSKE